MRASGFLAYMRREARGARTRFAFFVGCLAVGVAAVVAVAGLASGLERGIRAQGRELLAADLALSGLRPPPEPALKILAERPGIETVTVKEMATVVAAPGDDRGPGRSQIVELKVVGPAYPFYGFVETDPAGPLEELLSATSTVIAPELGSRLGVARGGTILIGGREFEVAGFVAGEPDRIRGAFTLGPRVLLSPAGLERAALERLGSRVVRRVLVKVAGPDLEELAAELRGALPAEQGFRVETHAEAQPELRAAIRRAERFLGLVALLSLLIGGVGVAQTLRAWLAGRMDSIAVLRCLGFRPREVVLVYLGQSMALGLIGSLVGAGLGTLVVAALPTMLAGILPVVDLPALQPRAVSRGVGLGLGVSLLFALGPLLAAGRISPLRVMRRDLEPSPAGRGQRAGLVLLVALGVFAVAALQAASVTRGLLFTLGVGGAAAVLALAGWSGTWLVARFPLGRGRPWLRNGLRALARPGAATMSAVTALGLGVLFVVAIALVERAVSGELATTIPPESPTAFLIDVQPDQWGELERKIAALGATSIESVPVVTARLTAIDGRRTSDLAEDLGRRGDRWALTREQRLTWAAELEPDNRLVAGELWSLAGVDEISVEEDFARDLGVELGSTLRFDIQGTEIDLTVSSLRRVDWRSFGINFFLVAEPAALDGAPHVRLAAARLPDGRDQEIQDALAALFPNVTLIRTREILEKVGQVLGRLGAGVRFLGGFTVLAGIVILAGSVSAAAVRRGPEIALLKTLGSTRAQVVAQFLVENALLGFVAGTVGAAGANVLAFAVVTRSLDLAFAVRPGLLAAAVLATTVLTALTGTAAGWSALRRRPLEVLRSD